MDRTIAAWNRRDRIGDPLKTNAALVMALEKIADMSPKWTESYSHTVWRTAREAIAALDTPTRAEAGAGDGGEG
jgi:hypothetical protein